MSTGEFKFLKYNEDLIFRHVFDVVFGMNIFWNCYASFIRTYIMFYNFAEISRNIYIILNTYQVIKVSCSSRVKTLDQNSIDTLRVQYNTILFKLFYSIEHYTRIICSTFTFIKWIHFIKIKNLQSTVRFVDGRRDKRRNSLLKMEFYTKD